MSETVTLQTLRENPEKQYHILDDRAAKVLLFEIGHLGLFRMDVPEAKATGCLQMSWTERETHWIFCLLHLYKASGNGFEIVCLPKSAVSSEQALLVISEWRGIPLETLQKQAKDSATNSAPVPIRVSHYDNWHNALAYADQETASKIKLHDWSMYSFTGEHIGYDGERGNLFDTVFERTRYVVDTNSDWKGEAGKPENKNKAFIISKTLLDEQHRSIKGTLFNNINYANRNLFVLTGDSKGMLLERLDEPFVLFFDDERTKEIMAGGERCQIIERERKHMVKEIEADILARLGIKSVSEIAQCPELPKLQEFLWAEIAVKSPRCKLNFFLSLDVAQMCYGLLLTERGKPSNKTRREFSDDNKINKFGDAFVLMSALYLQANILSGDNALTQMAEYAGLKTFETAPPDSQPTA